jgi:hypothetical protein
VVTVYHHSDVNFFAKRLWHIGRDCFRDITIELSPVKRQKRIQADIWVGRIENKSRVMFELEIAHHMNGSLKTTFTGICKIGQYHGDFGRNVNAPEVYHPTQNTDQVLIER